MGKKSWFWLIFKFFECVGIVEILNQQVKKGECIFIFSMNVKILVFVVKNFRIDVICFFLDYYFNVRFFNKMVLEVIRRYIVIEVQLIKFVMIFIGDDQLIIEVFDIVDEDKIVKVIYVEVIVSILNVIYVKYWDNFDIFGQVFEMCQ